MATTLNPSDKATDVVLSGGDLTATNSVNPLYYNGVRSIASNSSGKFYNEFLVNAIGAVGDLIFGLVTASPSMNNYNAGDNDSVVYANDHNIYSNNGTLLDLGVGFTAADIVCMAVDFDNSKLWFRINGGNWNNNGSADPATNSAGISISGLNAGPYFVVPCFHGTVASMTANFGDTSYAQTAPAGFGNWGATGASTFFSRARRDAGFAQPTMSL